MSSIISCAMLIGFPLRVWAVTKRKWWDKRALSEVSSSTTKGWLKSYWVPLNVIVPSNVEDSARHIRHEYQSLLWVIRFSQEQPVSAYTAKWSNVCVISRACVQMCVFSDSTSLGTVWIPGGTARRMGLIYVLPRLDCSLFSLSLSLSFTPGTSPSLHPPHLLPQFLSLSLSFSAWWWTRLGEWQRRLTLSGSEEEAPSRWVHWNWPSGEQGSIHHQSLWSEARGEPRVCSISATTSPLFLRDSCVPSSMDSHNLNISKT